MNPAITSPARSKTLPNIPTVVEAGYPKLVAENFVGLSGPAGMPAAAVARLNAAVNEALHDPKFIARLEDLAFIPKPMTPAEFTGFVQKQVSEFQPAVKASGAKLN